MPLLPGLSRLPRQGKAEQVATGAKGSSFLPETDEDKQAVKDSELRGQYKKAADSLALNISLLCNSYLQKHAKWHSPEVCCI